MKICFVFLLAFCTTTSAQSTIEISAGKYPRSKTIVSVKQHLPGDKSYELFNNQTGHIYPVQVIDSLTFLFYFQDSIGVGKKQSLTLRPVKKSFLSSGTIKIEKSDSGLLATVKGKPVFYYHIKESMPPSDSPAYYRRSGFIHPMYSPSGKILTDDFPVTHAHQHGIFFSWVNTTFKKDSVDFWNLHLRKGTVKHMELVEIKEGPVCTTINTRLRYVSFKHGEVLEEKWTIVLYPFSDYFMIDLFSEQTNISTDTLFLNKYHYGGLAFRGTKNWDPENKKDFQNNWHILTSEGFLDSSANHTHARWVDASGQIDGQLSGLTVFNHPSNFRYPQPIRVHPTMPYWSYAPVIDGDFSLAPRAVYHSQFRYFVHNGGPDEGMIEKMRQDWAEPVETKAK